MLRAICKTCEDANSGETLPVGWWNDCTHDPYVSYVEVAETRPVYQDNPDGSKTVTGQETIVRTEARPNWVAVSNASAVNYGKGAEVARRKGFIFPQQLASPMWPDGIKQRCQFRECYSENVKKYSSGWFCRELEAKLVQASDDEMPLMYAGQPTPKAENLRRKQLESIQVSA